MGSLGGAMAALAAFDLVDTNYRVSRVYTYGQPRIGNKDWVSGFNHRMMNVAYFRVVDYKDPIPHLPPSTWPLSFWHPGPQVFYHGTYQGAYSVVSGEDSH